MIKVILLGSGNVAIHLAKAFVKSKNIDFIQRYSRSADNDSFFDKLIPTIYNINTLKLADIYVISITDDAISEFSKKLKIKKGLVVHTSGSVSLDALRCTCNKGVLYPLQTFSKEKKMDIKNIPFTYEIEKQSDLYLLEQLANSLSNHTYQINTEQRKNLHIAAVFANNFTNHMYTLAEDICNKNGLSFDILKPLIAETANKMLTLNPIKAQTGPAKRNDQKVIENHLEHLHNNQKEIYKLVTNSIINSHHKK